jgi:hypothetical protein
LDFRFCRHRAHVEHGLRESFSAKSRDELLPVQGGVLNAVAPRAPANVITAKPAIELPTQAQPIKHLRGFHINTSTGCRQRVPKSREE